jgi:hypothetical protein
MSTKYPSEATRIKNRDDFSVGVETIMMGLEISAKGEGYFVMLTQQ